jgi:hypothetical protein
MGILEDFHTRLETVENKLAELTGETTTTPAPSVPDETTTATTDEPSTLVVGENTAPEIAPEPVPTDPPVEDVPPTDAPAESTNEEATTTEEAPGINSDLVVSPTHTD